VRLSASLTNSIQHLATGYFAAVMATGIVSIALLLQKMIALSNVFFAIDAVLYVLLFVGYLLRVFMFRKEVWGDLTHAGKVFGYFTFIAGSDVLGTRFALAHEYIIASVLGLLALISWIALTYFILVALLFYNEQPIQNVINGSWLVMTVSCESLTVLGSALADYYTNNYWLMFMACAFWALGIVIYLIFIAMIMYRFFFFKISTKDLTPPYWINMGAMAITTLAGARLVLYPHSTTFLQFIEPFVEGTTFVLWVWGTWWIPWLIMIGVGKYVLLKERFQYSPALWSMVFPLGMYTCACKMVGSIHGLGLILHMVPTELYIALTGWTVVSASFFYGMIQRRLSKNARSNQIAG
jgi:tellurite resistance protein TehA-like permease